MILILIIKRKRMEEFVQIDSKKLFMGTKIVQITHNGKVYTLRITRDDKLILTK